MVADFASMAKMELKAKGESLTLIALNTNIWEIINLCEGCRRTITKVCVAVERTICEYERIFSQLVQWDISQVEKSLDARRAFAKFRDALQTQIPPTEETFYARLKSAGFGIAVLVGEDVYPELRITDRFQIRKFQGEINDWVREHSEQDLSGSHDLWEDLSNFAEILLAQINQRSERVEHDQKVLEETLSQLTDGQVNFNLKEPTCPLRSLSGRDEKLDRLIDNTEDHSALDWKQALERVLVSMTSRDSMPDAAPDFRAALDLESDSSSQT